ncbi:MAG TPA: pentapeptide repeat-containing protein, partial [Trichocoleus sp.]
SFILSGVAAFLTHDQGTWDPWLGVAASTFIAIVGYYIATLALSESKEFSWLKFAAIASLSLGRKSFRKADLTDADFMQAILPNVDLREARLLRTFWFKAKGLDCARLGNTYLANPRIRQLVVSCDGRGKTFDGLDLTGVNLQDANLQDASFIGANLNQSNLRGADLSRAILKQTQLDGADLTGATLTGAYIEDWGITSTTKLENVQCNYVYMQIPTKDNPNPLRKPDNLREFFAEGEFADFIQPYFDTLDLYHSQEVDPRAISIAFKKLSQNHPEANLEIVAMEKRGQNSLNLKVRTTSAADKSELSSEYFADYNKLKALSEARLLLLAEKDDRIRSLEQMIQTALHQPTFNVETVQGDFMPEHKGINVSAGDNSNISGVSSGDGIINLGTISGNVTNAINQLSDSSQTGQASLKVLLTQLQAAIETDTDLPDPDKSDLLEQVQSLAEAKHIEEPTKREGIARKAMKMFDATLKSLPDTTKLVEACSQLLPLILKALGIPA